MQEFVSMSEAIRYKFGPVDKARNMPGTNHIGPIRQWASWAIMHYMGLLSAVGTDGSPEIQGLASVSRFCFLKQSSMPVMSSSTKQLCPKWEAWH